MKYKLLIAAAAGLMLLAATPAAAAEQSVTVSLDVSKETAVLCAADLLDTIQKGDSGLTRDHTVLEQYVAAAKLTTEQQAALSRDCVMFSYGAQFASLVLKEPEADDAEEPAGLPPGVSDTVLKK